MFDLRCVLSCLIVLALIGLIALWLAIRPEPTQDDE